MKISWTQLKEIIRNKRDEYDDPVVGDDEEILECIYSLMPDQEYTYLGKTSDDERIHLDGGTSTGSQRVTYFVTKRESDGYLMSYNLFDFVTQEELDKFVHSCHCCAGCGKCHRCKKP